MLSDKVDDATFRNYEKKLQKMFFDITNEMAIDVHFYNNQEWIAIFEDKMPVYELFIEYYKCSPTIKVGYSINFKGFYITSRV